MRKTDVGVRFKGPVTSTLLTSTFAFRSGGFPFVGAEKSTQTFFVQSFSTTLRVMDVRAENRGRPRQKVCFPAAPVMGRNFLTPGHPGVRVRNVRGKSGPKSLCLCCFFFPDFGGLELEWSLVATSLKGCH